MARKQEKPESTVEPQDPTSTTESSGSQPEGGASTLSPGDAASPNPGESGVSETDPGSGDSTEQALPEALENSGPGLNVSASDLSTIAGASATKAGASEGTGQNGPAAAESGDDIDLPVDEGLVAANPNPATLQIYPMRSYMDEGELRRRDGPAYVVPRRHAEELVQRKLASLEPLKE